MSEASLDRYLVTRIESWTRNRSYPATTRIIFNPSRARSNAAQGRMPWHRAVRLL